MREIIKRELELWKRRPIYVLAPLAAMLFCGLFFLTFFGSGSVQELPVAVVDNDNSSLTRNFVRQLDATELGKVVRFDDYASAREAMQNGEVTAICVLPENMYSDVLSGRKPVASFYLNTMYYVGGMMSYKNLLTMFNLSIGAVQRETMRAMGMPEDAIMATIQPILIDVHQIGNPTTDYNAYLSNILLPGLLELLTIIVVAYALGTEIKYGTSLQLLEMSSDSIVKVLLAKLIPYTLLFSVLGCVLVLVLYGPMHFPLAGSIWAMMLNIVLMVLASEAFAVCIVALLPVCRLAVCISAFLGILAFSLSGFTVPLEQMPGFFRGMATIFPLRAYYNFYVQETIFASGFAGWWKEVIHYMIFFLAPLPLLPRLKNAYRYNNYRKD
ncbi:ABC transporter permease [bacterium]|nr:ABC transporter permease [bacterium]